MKNTMTTLTQAAALTGLLAASAAPALAQAQTINFDTLTSPATGVGPAVRAYQEYGPGTFTIIRIPDAGGSNPASYGDHFHTVAGNGSAGNPNATAAEFFSDDGQPILYFDGNYTGTSSADYAPNFSTAKSFSLTSFNILSLTGTFQLTATAANPAGLFAFAPPTAGNTLTIDHAGIYNLANTPGLSGFQNIMAFRHDYTGTTDGSMIIDDITITPTAAPVPEASSVVGLSFGLFFLGGLVLAARRKRISPG